MKPTSIPLALLLGAEQYDITIAIIKSNVCHFPRFHAALSLPARGRRSCKHCITAQRLRICRTPLARNDRGEVAAGDRRIPYWNGPAIPGSPLPNALKFMGAVDIIDLQYCEQDFGRAQDAACRFANIPISCRWHQMRGSFQERGLRLQLQMPRK